MAKRTSINTDDLSRAENLRDNAENISDYRKALSLILMAGTNLNPGQVGELLGVSRRTVFRNLKEIRTQGETLKKRWGGRRNSLMSIEEEREFLDQWKQKAESGGILTTPPIHAALVKRLGRKIPISTTYRLLARHGWRKVQPDTKHPKSDPAVQDEFKKNSLRRWLPPA